jgi:hypothetical protein
MKQNVLDQYWVPILLISSFLAGVAGTYYLITVCVPFV